jgi:hypothetical protein
MQHSSCHESPFQNYFRPNRTYLRRNRLMNQRVFAAIRGAVAPRHRRALKRLIRSSSGASW